MRCAAILLAFVLNTCQIGSQANAAHALLAAGGHDVDLGDVRLHYMVRGQGPLLFVASPGWGVGSNYLQIGLAQLEQRLTMVYIDMRGSGGSTRPADRSRMSQAVMADDIDRLRQRLGLDSIDLFGHSDGGTIAIEYAVRHPQHLRKLLLVAPSVLGDKEPRSLLKVWADDPQYRLAIQRLNDPAWNGNLTDDEFQRLLLGILPLYVSDPSRYAATFADTLKTTRLSAYAWHAGKDARKKAARDQFRDAASIQARTLILNGTVDWICSYQAAQRLHGAIPNSELHLYANKGHMLWIEARPRFFDDVEKFFAVGSRPRPTVPGRRTLYDYDIAEW